MSVRVPTVVYEAYLIRAAKSGRKVRTVMSQALTTGVRRSDVEATRAVSTAIALLLASEQPPEALGHRGATRDLL